MWILAKTFLGYKLDPDLTLDSRYPSKAIGDCQIATNHSERIVGENKISCEIMQIFQLEPSKGTGKTETRPPAKTGAKCVVGVADHHMRSRYAQPGMQYATGVPDVDISKQCACHLGGQEEYNAINSGGDDPYHSDRDDARGVHQDSDRFFSWSN